MAVFKKPTSKSSDHFHCFWTTRKNTTTRIHILFVQVGRDLSIIFCWHQNHGISQKIGKKTGKTRARNPQPHNQGISELVQSDLWKSPATSGFWPPDLQVEQSEFHIWCRWKGVMEFHPFKKSSMVATLVIFPYTQLSKSWLFWLWFFYIFFPRNWVFNDLCSWKRWNQTLESFSSVDPWIYTSVCQAIDLPLSLPFPSSSLSVNSKHGGWVQTLQLSTVDSVWRILAAAFHPNLDHRWQPKLKARSPTKCDRFAPRQRGEGAMNFSGLQSNKETQEMLGWKDILELMWEWLMTVFWWAILACMKQFFIRKPIESPWITMKASLIHPPYKIFPIYRCHKNHRASNHRVIMKAPPAIHHPSLHLGHPNPHKRKAKDVGILNSFCTQPTVFSG